LEAIRLYSTLLQSEVHRKISERKWVEGYQLSSVINSSISASVHCTNFHASNAAVLGAMYGREYI
jgi:hypothetical protein